MESSVAHSKCVQLNSNPPACPTEVCNSSNTKVIGTLSSCSKIAWATVHVGPTTTDAIFEVARVDM